MMIGLSFLLLVVFFGVDFDDDCEDEPDGIYFDIQIQIHHVRSKSINPNPNPIQINHYLHLHDIHQLH